MYLEGSGGLLPIRSQILTVATPVVINSREGGRERVSEEESMEIFYSY